MSLSQFFSRPDMVAITLALSIPIVAIIVGGISSIIKRLIKHRERMAMIEQGLHPDFPPEPLAPEEEDGAAADADAPTP